jgi:hypothetical protein
MDPYLQKRKAAQRLVELKQFPAMWDVAGREWAGERYHLMYTEWFSGYFFYKISGVAGALESCEGGYTGSTWWGFQIRIANYGEHRDDFEQPLPATEVKAWLALNYGRLEADDYEHLINILHLEHTPDGGSVHQLRDNYNWRQALSWLSKQYTRAINLGTSSAAIVSTQSWSPIMNPWLPLLISSMKLADFYKYLEGCGLLTPEGKLTLLGQGNGLGKTRKAPWVGALLALTRNRLLDNNMAAVCRALASPAGKLQVKLADNSLLTPSNKADTFLQVSEAVLRERSYLRN